MAKRRKKRKTIQPSRCTILVRVDDDPIRKKLNTDLKRARTYYKRAQKEWEVYENEILPAYEDWLKRAEGVLPMKIAEQYREYQMKTAVLKQASEISWEYRISMEEAFARVIDAMENIDKYPRHEDLYGEDEDDNPFSDFWDDDDGPESSGMEKDAYELEVAFYRDVLFADLSLKKFGAALGKWMGEDLRAMSDDELHEIREDMRWGVEERMKAGAFPRREVWDTSAASGGSSSLKKKYREVAKQLHPDVSGTADEQTQRLWIEVQEAYEQGDEEFIDVVLARMRLNDPSETGQRCWDLKAAVMFFRDSLKSLRNTLRKEKKKPAWIFSQLNAAEQQRWSRDVRSELEDELRETQHATKQARQDYDRLDKKRKKFDPEVFRREEWELVKAKKAEREQDRLRDPEEEIAAFFEHVMDEFAEKPSTGKKKKKPADSRQAGFDFLDDEDYGCPF